MISGLMARQLKRKVAERGVEKRLVFLIHSLGPEGSGFSVCIASRLPDQSGLRSLAARVLGEQFLRERGLSRKSEVIEQGSPLTAGEEDEG